MLKVELRVACSLTDHELQERRNIVLQKIGGSVLEVKELESGYAYRFPSDEGSLMEIAQLINLERRCCSFLNFRVSVEAGDGPMWLELSGPEGTKSFLGSLFKASPSLI